MVQKKNTTFRKRTLSSLGRKAKLKNVAGRKTAQFFNITCNLKRRREEK
jgi:hypothetical protein